MPHPRNKHQTTYDLPALIGALPELKEYVKPNKYGKQSIDFFNPKAVKALNKAILIHQYGLKDWDIPDGQLCPPIPGRADYLHYAADLLAEGNKGKLPQGHKITCLDIGTGANCIYPLLGSSIYNWKFIGTDSQESSLTIAQKNLNSNPQLIEYIELRRQKNKEKIFSGIWEEGEFIDLVITNPPFHASEKEARKAQLRKLKNLKHNKQPKFKLNFGGNAEELWCEGGEIGFISRMIKESKSRGTSCFWFTSLLAREKHIPPLQKILKKEEALQVKIIPMGQGNKISRLICWSFLSKDQQTKWAKAKW
ncbi:MAG: 23S rRNA (adenine(1618)-N(6))-methyltransferase RlmF [Bacteroidia bacterium]|nr:23S rRNA (adenine(1618)-N(6))-methyltransferase RlmF [Bacteroidia bacterium]